MPTSKGDEKRMQTGIKLKYINMSAKADFQDINDWIKSILETYNRKIIQYDAMKKELEEKQIEIDALKGNINR